MNKYEAMFLINPELGEDEVRSVIEKFKTLIEANGTMDAFAEWGKRKLAYEINDLTEAYYCLATFAAESDFPAELERVLKITDGILRYLVIRKN